MNREALKGFLSIGVFVGGGGILLALYHPPDTPEYVVSVCSAVIGLLLVAGAITIMRLTRS